MTGQRIAHYQILEKLGEGGMGVVYKALDTKLNRFVALKFLAASRRYAPELRERFLNEARAASSLGHSGIVTIHDILEHEGVECIVMELIAGKTLEQLLRAGLPRMRDALDYAVQIADALAAAHRAGLIHRDLKPGNIMITGDGHVKVVDFGLAKLAQAPPAAQDDATIPHRAITEEGAIIGTAGYMSPEQAEGRKLDSRSDIFSFGAVLYELITGKRAFSGETRISTLAAVIREDPPPLPQVTPDAPRGLDIIVSGCLRKDPTRRFQHLSDVRIILEKLRDEADSGTASQISSSVLPPKRPRWRLVAAALAFTLAGAALATAILLWKAPRHGPGSPAQRIVRLTRDGRSREPAISLDGRLVAYISSRHDAKRLDLWVQQVGSGTALRLTDDPAPNHNPVFSADGSKIWFFSGRQPSGVYEVSSLGGEARLLLPDATSVRPSPDGKWLAYIGNSASFSPSSGYNLPGKLMLRSTEGGEARELAPANRFTLAWLAWSADSRELLAGSVPEMGFAGPGLYQVPIEGGPPRRRTAGALEKLQRSGLGNLNLSRLVAWFPDDSIAFAARFGDAVNVFRLPLPPAPELRPIALTAGPLNNSDASIQGNHMVYTHRDTHPEIWSLPVDLNSGKVRGELQRVTAEGVEGQFPDVRPDGSTLVYHSRKFGSQGVFQIDLKTGKDRTVASGESDFAYATLSPDGAKVAIGQGGKGWPAYLVSTAGGDVKPIGNAYGRLRGWTPDGRYILVWRAVPPRNTLGVLEVASGKASEIAASETLDLHSPRLSPNGNWVLFSSSDGQSSDLRLASFHGNQTIPQPEWKLVAEGAGLGFWSPDGRSLYYVKSPELRPAGATIYRQPVDPITGRLTGPATEFYNLDGYTLAGGLINSICANRDQVFLTVMQGRSDIWMTTLPE